LEESGGTDQAGGAGVSLGFLGTGAITEAVITGLGAAPEVPDIVISPRAAARSSALAARFANVAIAPDNQTVLDRADTVVLALRPQDVEAALDGLRFRRGQMIISFVALLPMVRLKDLVTPADRICRAVPLPSAALRIGPIALWPALPDVADLLGRIGTVVAAPAEELLEPLWATTALMAPFYEQLHQVTCWLAANGVPTDIAASYIAQLYAAWGRVATEHTDDLPALRDASQTRGGLNEQALRQLGEADHYRSLRAALDAVLRRLTAAK
jgi:pyrroline-5-carboxylate reductase